MSGGSQAGLSIIPCSLSGLDGPGHSPRGMVVVLGWKEMKGKSVDYLCGRKGWVQGARGRSLMFWGWREVWISPPWSTRSPPPAASGPGQVHREQDSPFTCSLPTGGLLCTSNVVSPCPASWPSLLMFSAPRSCTLGPVFMFTFRTSRDLTGI